jgi:hypothetical protein
MEHVSDAGGHGGLDGIAASGSRRRGAKMAAKASSPAAQTIGKATWLTAAERV